MKERKQALIYDLVLLLGVQVKVFLRSEEWQ